MRRLPGVSKLKSFAAFIAFYENWPLALADAFKLVRSGTVTYRLRQGVTFHNAELGLINDLWIRRNYTPRGFEIGPDDIVIDIGAHRGVFTVLAGLRARRVLAYEPNAENYGYLRRNVAANRLRAVETHRLAVAGTSSRRTLYLSDDGEVPTVAHTLFIGTPHASGLISEQVRTTTLTDIFRTHKLPRCDFLKMDCEGAEYEILFATPPSVLRCIRRMVVECHPIGDNTIKTMAAFLRQGGFQVFRQENVLFARKTGI